MKKSHRPDSQFASDWNDLPPADRRRIRRTVRMGRPFPDEQEAALAAQYAEFQANRPWIRFFWLWFVPGIILALGVATQIHPIMIGIVLALGGQAVFAHRSLRRHVRTRKPIVASA